MTKSVPDAVRLLLGNIDELQDRVGELSQTLAESEEATIRLRGERDDARDQLGENQDAADEAYSQR